MEYFFDLKSQQDKIELLNTFKSIYEEGFPDVNEREDYDVILNRVSSEKPVTGPYSIIVLDNAITVSGATEVTGGLIADWYETSQSIHLIYIIITEKHRRKGIAKKLINEGIKNIIDWIRIEKGITIKNVFFESNIPWKTKKENDNFDQVERLMVFSSMGAKWIDIPYVQPALDSQKEIVDNLFLLSFTQFNAKKNKIPADEIMAFLYDLYKGLGVVNLLINNSLITMEYELNRKKNANSEIVLKNIPYEKQIK